jgi:predicted N-acetyltransferase YhbS
VKVRVRPLAESELDEAGRILRLAFDTTLGLKSPASNFGDRDLVRTRWRTNPDAAFAAELDGRRVGSNFATNWGSVAFLGPLSVHPELWKEGIGSQLLEPSMELFAKWRSRPTLVALRHADEVLTRHS